MDGGETRLYAGGSSRVAHDFGDYVAMGQIGLEVTSGQAWFDDAAATSTTEVTKETWYYYAESRRVAMRVDEGEGDAVYYIHGDHLGSTSLVTDEDGQVVARQIHYPFGEVRWAEGSPHTDYGYTGQRYDAGSALLFLHARYYDPALGRFISADTIVPEPGNPQSLNRYSYVYNRPLVYVDDSGHVPVIPILVGAVVVGLKVVDYGWTAYDVWQSGRVLDDPDASWGDKLMAGLNIGLAAIFEAIEPDDVIPVSVPLDDMGRRALMRGAQEAFEEGGEEALEHFLRDALGDNAEEVLRRIDNALGLGNIRFPENPGQIDHIFRDAPGHLIDDTFDNRQLLQNAVSSENFVRTDQWGNQWFARLLEDGTEIWVKVRNGVIQNGGVNQVPRHQP